MQQSRKNQNYNKNLFKKNLPNQQKKVAKELYS